MSEERKKSEQFEPTLNQRIYALKCARKLRELAKSDCIKKDEKITQSALAEEMGISASRISEWKQKPGYEAWHNEELALLLEDMHDTLEAVARKRIEDFKFWEKLAEKYGYLKAAGATEEREQLIIDLSGDGSAQKEKEEKA